MLKEATISQGIIHTFVWFQVDMDDQISLFLNHKVKLLIKLAILHLSIFCI